MSCQPILKAGSPPQTFSQCSVCQDVTPMRRRAMSNLANNIAGKVPRLDKRAAKPSATLWPTPLPRGPSTWLGTPFRGSPTTTAPKPWRRVSINLRHRPIIVPRFARTLSSRLGPSAGWGNVPKECAALPTGRGQGPRPRLRLARLQSCCQLHGSSPLR